MIGESDAASDFHAVTQTGQPISLSTFRGKPVVLYFYPRANSSGCAMEARGFAQHYVSFKPPGPRSSG
jgi:thioredoxin-dependent peroxiredoxin